MAKSQEIEAKLDDIGRQMYGFGGRTESDQPKLIEWLKLYEGSYCEALFAEGKLNSESYIAQKTPRSHMYIEFLRLLAAPLLGKSKVHPGNRE